MLNTKRLEKAKTFAIMVERDGLDPFRSNGPMVCETYESHNLAQILSRAKTMSVRHGDVMICELRFIGTLNEVQKYLNKESLVPERATLFISGMKRLVEAMGKYEQTVLNTYGDACFATVKRNDDTQHFIAYAMLDEITLGLSDEDKVIACSVLAEKRALTCAFPELFDDDGFMINLALVKKSASDEKVSRPSPLPDHVDSLILIKTTGGHILASGPVVDSSFSALVVNSNIAHTATLWTEGERGNESVRLVREGENIPEYGKYILMQGMSFRSGNYIQGQILSS